MGTTNSQIVEGQNSTKLIIDLFKSTATDNLTILYLGDFYKKGYATVWDSLLTKDIESKKDYISSLLLFCIKAYGNVDIEDNATIDGPGFLTIAKENSTFHINISNIIQEEAVKTAEKLINDLNNKRGIFTPDSIAGKGKLSYQSKKMSDNKVLFTISAEIPV